VDTAHFAQDLAVTAAIFGVAAFVWFGWAQEAPPARWRLPLGLGSLLGLLLASCHADTAAEPVSEL
jgi:hypothetical protein